MAFPPNLLNASESVVLDLRPHWSKLVVPVFMVVLFTALTGTAFALAGGTGNLRIVGLVLAAVLLLLVLKLVANYATWTTTNFVVTTDRLIHREGVVAKKGIEIPLERVQNIAFNQTLLERMLGAGDLLIESGGESGQNKFTDIRKPQVVQNEIYRQIEANKDRDADRMAGARRDLSVPEQLEKLAELHQRGVLNSTEFEAQKAKLLDRM